MGEAGFGWINWTVFLSYLVSIFALGSFFSRRQTSTDEYFRAGKRMSWFPIMASLIASAHSALSFIGQPARIFNSNSALLITTYISGFFMFPVIAYIMLPFYRKLDITTAYEYLEKRFSVSVRLVASALFMMQRLIWMSLVCLAPSLVLSVVLGVKVEYCIILIGLIATIYTGLGGMTAVIWTDVVQFFILILGEAMIFIVVMTKLDGGFMEIVNVAVADNKIWGSFEWDITKVTFWTLLISGFVFGLTWGSDQVSVQRLMAAKNEKAARTALLSLIVINIPRYAIVILMGLSLYAFYQAFPQSLAPEVMESTDKLLPYFVATQIPVGLCGLVIAAIFAAAMSSFDSGLNCIAAAVTVDWYERLIKPNQSDARYLRFAKVLSFVLGIVVIGLALIIYQMGLKSIIDTSQIYIGFFFGPIAALFMLGIFSRRAKTLPAVIGALVGIVVVTVLDVLNKDRPDNYIINPYLYGFVSFVITIAIGYVGSLFGREQPYDDIKKFTLAKRRER